MTVREMMGTMTSAEYTGWIAYYNAEPFGRECDDISRAVLAALIANVNRNPKTHPEPFTFKDFLPFARLDLKPDQPTEHQQEVMNQLHLVLGR